MMIPDILAAFAPLYLFLGILLVFTVVIRSAWFKGWLGELEVNLVLRWRLDKRRYHLIKNVTIPTEDGTTQIDHVVVSVYGVFVIETKNLRGWIFGGEYDRNWTQKLYKKTFKFQNPLHQNYKHIQTLARQLGIPADCMISVIVFISHGEFKSDVPSNVTRGWRFIRLIQWYTIPILTEEQVQEIILRIAEQRLAPGLRTHLKHVKHVRQIVAEKGTGQKKERGDQAIAPTRPESHDPTLKPIKDAPSSFAVTAAAGDLSRFGGARPAVTTGGTTGMWEIPPPLPVQEEPAVEIKAPACPLCGGVMVLRQARKNTHAGDLFWGCRGLCLSLAWSNVGQDYYPRRLRLSVASTSPPE